MSNYSNEIITLLLTLTQQEKIKWRQTATQTMYRTDIDSSNVYIDYRKVVNSFRIIVFDKSVNERHTFNIGLNDMSIDSEQKRLTQLLYQSIRDKYDNTNIALSRLLEKLKKQEQ